MLKKPYSSFKWLPHQIEGVRWMVRRELPSSAEDCCGGILADDMGLGKTWQTIGLLLNAVVGRTLLVTPPVLTAQWVSALTKASVPVAHLRKGAWTNADASVYLVTYDKVWRNTGYLNREVWDRVILDEGHYIRNGAKTKRFLGISAIPSQRKWILSGTPVQNGSKDFRNLAAWLGCPAGDLSELAKRIMLRRSITLLSDVMPAAPTHVRHDVTIRCDGEHTMFQALVGRLEQALENNFPAGCILELYLRLQMFISYPQIYIDAMKRKYGDSYMSKTWTKGTSKMDAFTGLLAADAVTPTLVFCHFKSEMDKVQEVASSAGYNTYFVRGGDTESTRRYNIAQSIEAAAAGKPVLMICQINAGNCGLNLQHLTRVIFYTQHWNPAVMDQALARSYRYGQTKDVTVHHLVYGTKELLNIDKRMLAKHAEKRGAAIKIMKELEFAYHADFEADF
jgi:SNF2 family DNA or RNA helicase